MRKTTINLLIAFVLFGFTLSNAQEIEITGTVTQASDGQTLPGVTVLLRGTDIGTVTDIDGQYSLSLPDDSGILVFSFVGMETLEEPVEGRTIIDVELNRELEALEEVIVVGFGTQQRVNLSGAVDQIDTRELESRPISSVSQGLQGIIPNLNIDYLEGSPGTDPRINIRGFTSINEGDPLILIDNVPSTAGELSRLDPQDVASISVLKDAASAAIYGARAAFGVILIETKQGTREGINVNLSSRASWDTPTVLPNKTSDPYIYMRLQDISSSNTPWDYINYSDDMYEWARQRSDDPDSAPAVRDDPENPGTWQYMGNEDWISYFLSDYGMSTNYSLSLDGMTERTNYYLSGSFDRQDGALQIADDRFDRWSIRSRVNYQAFDWLSIGNNTLISMTDRVMPSRWDWGTWAMWDFYNHAPMAMDKNPDGTWADTSVGQQAAQLTDGGDLTDARESFRTTFNLVSPVIENRLTLNADYTVRRELRNYNYDYRRYSIGHGPEDIREHGSTLVYRNRTTYDYQVANIYGSLNLPFGDHLVTSVLGFNQEYNQEYAVITNVPNVVSSELPSLSLATGDPNVSDWYRDWAVRGAFFRFTYLYDDRYIVEFNGRYDGSSRFPREDRFGFFPSASVAWRIDQEAFMDGINWLDMFKLRGSYGALGNQSVSAYGYMPSMSAGRSGYIVGDSRPLAISSPGLVSPAYTWEQVNTRNFGVDIDLFERRFSAVFDIYTRETLGMLTLGRELPGVLGASEPQENAADLETKGWELSLNYREGFNFLGSRMNFGTRFILSDSRAWITGFDNPEKFFDQYYEGMELGEIWGMEFDGFFQSQEEIDQLDQTQIIPWGALTIVPGWPKFVDQDGNGVIEQGYTVDDPKDMKVIGNSQPRYRYGFNFDADWNNFDLRIFFQGIGKRDYYPEHYLYWGFFQQPYDGGFEHLFDFYRASDDHDALMAMHSQSYIDAGLAHANPDAQYPVLQAWLADNREVGLGSIPNTGYMLNAAYLRLKNLTVGYTLPQSLTTRANIERLRIYFSGENLAEWSELSDYFDPESVTDDGTGYRYPFQRRYSVGINVSF